MECHVRVLLPLPIIVCEGLQLPDITFPETTVTAKAPENWPGPKRKRESIPTIHFQGRAVSFREGIWLTIINLKQPVLNKGFEHC